MCCCVEITACQCIVQCGSNKWVQNASLLPGFARVPSLLPSFPPYPLRPSLHIPLPPSLLPSLPLPPFLTLHPSLPPFLIPTPSYIPPSSLPPSTQLPPFQLPYSYLSAPSCPPPPSLLPSSSSLLSPSSLPAPLLIPSSSPSLPMSPKQPLPSGWGLGFKMKPFSWQFMKFPSLLEISSPKTPNHRVGWGIKKNIDFLGSPWHFPDFLWIFDPLYPHLDPLGWGGVFKKIYWFSGQFMTFPGLLNFWPPKIPLAPPWGRVSQNKLGSNLSHIYSNTCAKFGCGPTVVNAMLVWQSRNVRKLRHPATIATIFLERPSLGSLVVRLITGDPIGISGVTYLCVAIRSLIP